MSRKSISVMLTILVVFSLALTGCKKSATPPLADIQAEDESAMMVEEAGANPTPVVVEPVAEEPTTVAPVEEATEAPTTEATEVVAEETEETSEVALPVVVSGDETEATPEATAEPVTTSTPGKHVVQAGENLFRIALRYGTTVEAISKANGITNAALIYVGQELTIPGGTGDETPAPVSSGEKIHIVQPGENLFRIALKYNYSQYYLAEYNGISNPALIYVGQAIRIP
ncbi:MAG: LysM peptidoglycan-binding domain-containing protein [Anaerolineae bacterium]|nr:LysM peptidoglycan-binding domain-containing protein [Anaerolineae bacterium]